MLKKYKPFLRAGAIDTMAYRFNILIWAFITICQVACMVFLWFAVYRSSSGGIDSEINGFTYRRFIGLCESADFELSDFDIEWLERMMDNSR